MVETFIRCVLSMRQFFRLFLIFLCLSFPGALAYAQDAGKAAPAKAEPVVSPPPMPHVPNFWDPQALVDKPARRIVSIRFLTSPEFPPFNFIAPDGRLSGFNVDLARAICEQLSAECTIQLRPFGELQKALEENRGDAIVAGIGISAESRKAFGFSHIYLRFPARFVAQKGTAITATADGLADKWVAVVAGTAHEAYLQAFFGDALVASYKSTDEALAALKSGKVDAYFGDGMTLGFWLGGETAGGCCVFAGGPYLDASYFGQGMAVAMAPGNTALRTAVNYALRRLHESGRYEELYLRYFPVSFF